MHLYLYIILFSADFKTVLKAVTLVSVQVNSVIGKIPPIKTHDIGGCFSYKAHLKRFSQIIIGGIFEYRCQKLAKREKRKSALILTNHHCHMGNLSGPAITKHTTDG